MNQPEVHDVIREFRRLLDSYDERIAIGETHLPLDELIKFYGQQGDELHLPFNFTLIYLPWRARAFRYAVNTYEAALRRQQELAPTAVIWPNHVLGNHDEHRIASRFGKTQARIAAMLLLTLRGTPTLYYGDEIGMTDVEIPPERKQDPWGKQVPGLGLGRDPERTPMQWDTGPHAGFSTVEPWLPVAPDYETVNVKVQRADPTSMLDLYRRLIKTRKASPALLSGRYRAVDSVPKDCFAYLREHAEQRMLVALNFSDDDYRLSLPDLGVGQLLISTHLDREGTIDLADLHLRGHEGAIVELRSRS